MLGVALATALALPPSPVPDGHGAAWEATLEQVVPAVVVLRVSATRSFDTETAGYYTATGFVVDAARGIILTNRHVVQPGPVVAEAVFQNHEEVEVHALYRDPVHDFGFFRFDPKHVRFMELRQLELAPRAARVGADVRVIGNDAGEKLSILAGTLARLDREAPEYGRDRYNDFNTFYYQAASNTSGGSSGSPVVDVRGRVVALNAGAKTRAASSFYLPLDRVVRALEHLRRGEPVARGTLQVVFRHRPYDELRRLGLRPASEAALRRERPGNTGMLVVDEVVPGGPAHGRLEPGDVVLRVEGRLVSDFLALEEAVDGAVGRSLAFEVERGGQPVRVEIEVGDLHAITPDAYLSVGRGVLNTLSYQQARNHAVPAGGVYVASPGYMLARAGVPRGAVITAVAGEPTPTLEAFEAVVAALPDGDRVPVRYFTLQNPRSEAVAVASVDRRWHTMERCVRDDASGRWPCTPSPEPPPTPPAPPATARLSLPGNRVTRRLAPSLAVIEFHVPYRMDGVQGTRFVGAGLVVDAERGLVITDRDTVPVALGDATLTFGESVQIAGRVLYLHPEHNLAVLGYDPALLGETPVRSADLRQRDLEPGDEVWLVGLSRTRQLVAEPVRVQQVGPASLPLTIPPRFRETNVELVRIANPLPTVGGVLADGRGRVLAHWASFSVQASEGPGAFFAGIPAALLRDVAEPLSRGERPRWRTLGAELLELSLADARDRGLSEAAARGLEDHDPQRRRVLAVGRVAADAPAAGILEEGDLLLALDGRSVTRVREVERAAVAAEAVSATLLRDGRELRLEVPTQPLSGGGTERALMWAGALLQAPHRAVAVDRGIPPEGVYVAWTWWGSPAYRFGVPPTRRIVAVDGTPTPDLDAFLAAVADKPDRGSVRLNTIDLEGKVEVITLKLDLQYWPTEELRRDGDGWERRVH